MTVLSSWILPFTIILSIVPPLVCACMCFMCLYLHVKAIVEKAFLVDEISMIYNVTHYVDTHIICLPVGEYFTTVFRMPIV